jgi:hypothetical protein
MDKMAEVKELSRRSKEEREAEKRRAAIDRIYRLQFRHKHPPIALQYASEVKEETV